jgi:hypothetical protein
MNFFEFNKKLDEIASAGKFPMPKETPTKRGAGYGKLVGKKVLLSTKPSTKTKPRWKKPN